MNPLNQSNSSQICAVIPAAGKGSRLGQSGPKILTPIFPSLTIWDVLYRSLQKIGISHIQLVLSSEGKTAFDSRDLQENPVQKREEKNVSYVIQPKPIGMGDAVFRGIDEWESFPNIVVIWGDQATLSERTLTRLTQTLRSAKDHTLVLPLCSVETPYVEYEFNHKKLIRILQSREGDPCRPGGLSDIGVFGLKTSELKTAWNRYLKKSESKNSQGRVTQEINFLPFLVYLSSEENWTVETFLVTDSSETWGVNTPEDLDRIRALFRERQG